MRILHTVEQYPPSVGGMQEVVRQISERLVRLGHDVTVATTKLKERSAPFINGVRIAEFDISGNEVKGYRGDTEAYRTFLTSGGFDVVTNFAAQQWATDLMLPILHRVPAKKVFVPTGFSGLYWRNYKRYFRTMPEYLKRYDMNVFLSNDYRDINFARQHGVSRMVVIPNGAGADEFLHQERIDIREKYLIPEDHFLIISVGSHTGIKGHAEAISIFRRAEISDATFLMIGNEPRGGCSKRCRFKQRMFNAWQKLRGGNKRMMVLPLSRRETVSAYHQADLFLFPSNIECSPIVLFECMASKTPFLTTDVGNAAEIVSWSSGGTVLPTRKTGNGFSKARVADSARMLEAVWQDPQGRGAMQESGHAAWQERFTWETIAESYDTLYRKLVKE